MPVSRTTRSGSEVKDGLILVGHGSRSERSGEEMAHLAGLVGAALAGVDVRLGYLEMTDPPAGSVIDDMADRGARRITVLPLVLLGAGHAKSDVPAIVLEARRRHPTVDFNFASPLGVARAAVEVLGTAVVEASAGGLALLVVSRGTSDPDANGDSFKAARLIAEWTGAPTFSVGFSGVTKPTVLEAAQTLATLGYTKIALSWWYLCYGLLIERGRDELAGWAAMAGVELVDCGHLGPDVRLVDPIVARFNESLVGASAVNCDACAYRAPWPGIEGRVGQALGVGHSHLAVEHRVHAHGA